MLLRISVLKRGYIGHVEIKIPWNRLGSEPVEFIIDDVFLLIETGYELTRDQAFNRACSKKRAQLRAFELQNALDQHELLAQQPFHHDNESLHVSCRLVTVCVCATFPLSFLRFYFWM